ncbi:DUF4294 domain-containing protein [Flavobacterium silvaticum]|uniref:DUF4294 domain-containing protein n=1 Tax=Flavobacterium silvaticum TaxID=1852020 RepID=A0A972FXX2_9FLAO|nr:DUF4294 domain-containing protein [Flavobacterium silvaticum]NMH26871.1 DUF4294 domain-containing protein [Flavobacterium silvaticum]
MKIHILVAAFLIGTATITSQEVKKDTVPENEEQLSENDSIMETIYLDDVIISRHKLSYEDQKAYLLLQSRVYKVYPFAKIASERLTMLDNNMAKLKTSREKKKYYKIVEDYIENEFTDKLKKLSRKQGQILVKLVYRQTGKNVYSLIKDYKSGFKAFVYNNTGKMFDIDIKRGYDPQSVNEDYLIEGILDRAFKSGRLVRQNPYTPWDIDKLDDLWIQRAEDQAAKKEEN